MWAHWWLVTNTQLLVQRSPREQWGPGYPEEDRPLPGGAAVAYLQLRTRAKCCQVFWIFKRIEKCGPFFLWEGFWFCVSQTETSLASGPPICDLWLTRQQELSSGNLWAHQELRLVQAPRNHTLNFVSTLLGWEDSSFMRVKNPWPADFWDSPVSQAQVSSSYFSEWQPMNGDIIRHLAFTHSFITQ